MNKIQKIIITAYLILSFAGLIYLIFHWDGTNPPNFLLALGLAILMSFIPLGVIAFIIYKIWDDKK